MEGLASLWQKTTQTFSLVQTARPLSGALTFLFNSTFLGHNAVMNGVFEYQIQGLYNMCTCVWGEGVLATDEQSLNSRQLLE